MSITLFTTFTTLECFNCNVAFAMTDKMYRRRLADRKDFCCPNGHWQHFTGKSEAEKLRDQIEAKDRELTREAQARRNAESALKGAEYQVRAQKAAKTRIKNRVANGVCPCCARTFENLARHMKTKHPEMLKDSPHA